MKGVGRLPAANRPTNSCTRYDPAKRLRYLAEVAAPVIRRPEDRCAASATAWAATAPQDILGELHDAVVRSNGCAMPPPIGPRAQG